MKPKKPIFVTVPFLPPLEEFQEYLAKIWESKWLTNNGQFHQELENKLCEYLGVPFISLFANGTLALMVALKALNITGEVITTPFSFVATTHSLLWNNLKPVFVDIEPKFCNLDPGKIESAISERTSAIMPVHVYGNPCEVNQIQEIANKHRLKVIYDAAHAFGVEIGGRSVLKSGNLSVLSFHATKVFNTFEGGAIVSHDAETKKQIDCLKNFGFSGETNVVTTGINAKMSEFQAAMGLLQLKYFNDQIKKRRYLADHYREKLKGINGLTIIEDMPGTKHNYGYFPIFIDEKTYGMNRDQLHEKLKKHNIYSRRYFYPLISHFQPYIKLPSAAPENLPVAENTASRVLCLPIYPELNSQCLNKIIDVIST